MYPILEHERYYVVARINIIPQRKCKFTHVSAYLHTRSRLTAALDDKEIVNNNKTITTKAAEHTVAALLLTVNNIPRPRVYIYERLWCTTNEVILVGENVQIWWRWCVQ